MSFGKGVYENGDIWRIHPLGGRVPHHLRLVLLVGSELYNHMHNHASILMIGLRK